MAALRHARGFGRVAALALCCLLAADQDAAARRAHRPKAVPRRSQRIHRQADSARPDPLRRHALRAGRLAGDRRLGRRRSRGRLRDVPGKLPRRVGSAKGSRDTRPVYPALVEICRRRAPRAARRRGGAQILRGEFPPVRISKIDDPNGFLTGYYEPIVDGSRVPTDDFKVPLYGRPRDIVHMGRKRKAESFPNTGRVVRRLARGKYVPYFDRAAIEDGALATRNLEICYLKDANDLLFIQIQGSARVRLHDGTLLRVNYDAHNGHPYTPVGRILIERNIITREDMSMDRIRKWMAENPDGGKELRRQNKSYVFFRTTGLPENEEARGAQGVPLTASRSIAVDRALHVYGTPFFIAAELPIATEIVEHEIPPPDDRAGHRLGDRRAGARRHLFRRRRGRRPHRRPDQESGAVRDADAARARSGRGRQGDAAAASRGRRRAARERTRRQSAAAAGRRAAGANRSPSRIPLPRPRPKS